MDLNKVTANVLLLWFLYSTLDTLSPGVQGLLCCQQSRNGTDCASLTNCTNGELCYHEVLLTNTGNKIHQLGCRSQQLCTGSVLIGKRGSANVVCSECCDQTFCNIGQCHYGLQTTHPPTKPVDPCANINVCVHGTCFVDTHGQVQCNCDIGYSGNNCDHKDVCHPNPCIHGTCKSSTSGYVCTCNHGYTGRNCAAVDLCANVCVHGTCFVDANRQGQCNCDIGYTGNNCDHKDVCHPNPCIHGTCKSSTSGYVCTCNHGYTGSTCDKVDACSQNPCLHGVCSTSVSGWHCTCDQVYSGRYCDIDIDECASSPCIHGKCYDHVNHFTCNCMSGYTGVICDHKIASSPVSSGALVCQKALGVPDPTDVWTIERCGPHEVCALEQYITSSGYVRHDLQCKDRLQCGGVSSSGKIVICSKCCDTDLCAAALCKNKGISPGRICFHCDFPVQSPQSCENIKLCNTDEVCSVIELSHLNQFDVKCSSKDSCVTIATGPTTCSSCCNYNLCNDKCTAKTSVSNPCSPNPCKHGKCSQQGANYACLCNIGYAGSDCDKELRDCKDVLDNLVPSISGNNIYTIKIDTRTENVRCDMDGGWTVLMNRESANPDFYKNSTQYALGFGSIRGNFWLGLEDMHKLTSDGRKYKLRVDLTSANGTKFYETYDDFSIGQRPEYTLYIGQGSSGTAGDSLRRHNGYGFTTNDIDIDSNKAVNCANYLHGAWWFYDCYDSCLTCPYVAAKPGDTTQCRSMSWNSVAYCQPLKTARMMMRPI